MENLEEILFFETDRSCAYCGIKDFRVLTIHHINQDEPKDESYDNKIVLCHNCHDLYHECKSPTHNDLLTIKKRLIYKTLTQQGVNALKEAYRKACVVASPYLVNHIVEMQLLRETRTLMDFEGLKDHPVGMFVIYELTDKGRQFVEKWGLR